MKIALIGLMASGKSTIGRLLAQQLKWAYFDTDAWIVSETGISINQLFNQQGEDFFRTLETAALKTAIAQAEPNIIATGGGIVIKAINQKLLKQASVVIYLDISIEQQFSRVEKDDTRPLLGSANKQKILLELKAKRDPLYRKIANHIICVDNKTPHELVEAICQLLKVS